MSYLNLYNNYLVKLGINPIPFGLFCVLILSGGGKFARTWNLCIKLTKSVF